MCVCVDTEHVVLARSLAFSPDFPLPPPPLITKSVLFPSVSLWSLPVLHPPLTILLSSSVSSSSLHPPLRAGARRSCLHPRPWELGVIVLRVCLVLCWGLVPGLSFCLPLHADQQNLPCVCPTRSPLSLSTHRQGSTLSIPSQVLSRSRGWGLFFNSLKILKICVFVCVKGVWVCVGAPGVKREHRVPWSLSDR